MSRIPDYATLYKVSILLLKENNITIDSLHMSESSKKVGCSKRVLYNHIQRIKQDIYEFPL